MLRTEPSEKNVPELSGMSTAKVAIKVHAAAVLPWHNVAELADIRVVADVSTLRVASPQGQRQGGQQQYDFHVVH